MEGRGVLYYASGRIAYDGEWRRGMFEGEGVLENEEVVGREEGIDFTDMENGEEYWVVYKGGFKFFYFFIFGFFLYYIIFGFSL